MPRNYPESVAKDISVNLENIDSSKDMAVPSQLGFQDPANSMMSGIIDLHHDNMFFVVLILIFVLFLLI